MNSVSPTNKPASATQIARLNDHFRRAVISLRLPGCHAKAEALGRISLSQGLKSFPCHSVLLAKVAVYNEFLADKRFGDPHDFGMLDFDGQCIIWTIDCFAPNRKDPSLDPTNPEITERVLKAMLAGEY